MEHFQRIRKSSFTPTIVQESFKIIVEKSGNVEEEEVAFTSVRSTPRESLEIDSPLNPYLLSPWRDPREARKHSLPSQQVSEGITASQVRRLSERGGEGCGPSQKEAEFLATLSQAPQPSGRRHSVITISKVPLVPFGRGRRESVAAYPAASRRESHTSGGPPATDPLGSIHNLQLDIMDDIVQARKARMKLWNTSSEKVCEVQTVDEAGSSTTPMRYTNRRYSDFVRTTLTPIPANRRTSEAPSTSSGTATTPHTTTKPVKKAGILATNTDLMSIITSLAHSATEINKVDDTPVTPVRSKPSTSANSLTPEPPGITRSNRSNSFDISILNNAKHMVSSGTSIADKNASALAGWFEKRHQPMGRKKSVRNTSTTVSFSKDVLDRFRDKEDKGKDTKKPRSKLRWDNRGAFVDAHVIGNAIEGFLRKSKNPLSRDSRQKKSSLPSKVSPSYWFGKGDDDDSSDTCESSFCSALKDLFVK